MPLGTFHEITGLLMRSGTRLCLLPDGGGTWRLDHDGDLERLVGQRVKVRGRRAEFDMLDVVAAWRVGEQPPAPWRRKTSAWLDRMLGQRG